MIRKIIAATAFVLAIGGVGAVATVTGAPGGADSVSGAGCIGLTCGW